MRSLLVDILANHSGRLYIGVTNTSPWPITAAQRFVYPGKQQRLSRATIPPAGRLILATTLYHELRKVPLNNDLQHYPQSLRGPGTHNHTFIKTSPHVFNLMAGQIAPS